jgi:hypothetical protein
MSTIDGDTQAVLTWQPDLAEQGDAKRYPVYCFNDLDENGTCAIPYKRDDCLPFIMVGLGETGTTAKLENVLSKKDDAVKL